MSLKSHLNCSQTIILYLGTSFDFLRLLDTKLGAVAADDAEGFDMRTEVYAPPLHNSQNSNFGPAMFANMPSIAHSQMYMMHGRPQVLSHLHQYAHPSVPPLPPSTHTRPCVKAR